MYFCLIVIFIDLKCFGKEWSFYHFSHDISIVIVCIAIWVFLLVKEVTSFNVTFANDSFICCLFNPNILLSYNKFSLKTFATICLAWQYFIFGTKLSD
jgi:hypothetical protein